MRSSAGIAPVVSEELFAQAQSCLIERRTKQYESEELLRGLRELLQRKGYLSEAMIEAAPGLASVHTYRAHFGTISEAYQLIGYVKPLSIDSNGRAWRREEIVQVLRALHAEHGFLSCGLIERERNLPSSQTVEKYFGNLRDLYALIGAPSKSHSQILKEAHARRSERMRGSPASLRPRCEHFSRDYLVGKLKALLREYGYLSVPLIKADPTLPSVTIIEKRFGSMVQAYRAAGWTVDRGTLATLRNRRRNTQGLPSIPGD